MFYSTLTAPASPPENVIATVLSSTEILVNWDSVPSVYQNGIITMYEVLYQPQETFNNVIMSNNYLTIEDTSQTSVLIAGLQESVSYNISVRAYTSVGEGPFSEEIVVATFEDCKYSAHHIKCFTLI